MPDANHTTSRESDPVRRTEPELSPCRVTVRSSLSRAARSGMWHVVKTAILGLAAVLLCQCHRQPSGTPVTPTPTPASTATPIPSATPVATPTVTPTATPATPPPPPPTPTPTPDPFKEGIEHVLQASRNGFLELRGKLKRTEYGSGSDPLYRVRKIYEGTFLFGEATSAELEEVYYNAGPQPVYNYHLYYQAPPIRGPMERYDDLRLNLNRVLEGFTHTFGYRYDAWTRNDPLKTAILLSSPDVAGSAEIQVHA
ncbi:MAG TPA: hypothetical protein VK692_02035, partial [Chthoniobacterales bacterium]|nr:hypothetical protein [Chthoniobacterales bacterium]